MPLFKFPTDLKHVPQASKKVLDFLSDAKLDESVLFDIRLCFEEAFINAVKYGNKLDSRLTVSVDVIKRPDNIEIVVCDQGKGFKFNTVPDPTEEENLIRNHGRGLFLIKKLMDQVKYAYDNGSCLHMIKKIKSVKQ
jgi:serine/threonine-protein kinase RsbW